MVDVDPPFAWNCQVVAGAGVIEDVQQLYHDMHSYLAGLHRHPCADPTSIL